MAVINPANEIRNLRQAVVARMRVFEQVCILRQRIANRFMKHFADRLLSVIVIHFDLIERLEEVKVIEQERSDVPLHTNKQLARFVKLHLLEWESPICEGKALSENEELRKMPFPSPEAKVGIFPMTVHERRQVKCYVLHSAVAQNTTIPVQVGANALILVVKD